MTVDLRILKMKCCARNNREDPLCPSHPPPSLCAWQVVSTAGRCTAAHAMLCGLRGCCLSRWLRVRLRRLHRLQLLHPRRRLHHRHRRHPRHRRLAAVAATRVRVPLRGRAGVLVPTAHVPLLQGARCGGRRHHHCCRAAASVRSALRLASLCVFVVRFQFHFAFFQVLKRPTRHSQLSHTSSLSTPTLLVRSPQDIRTVVCYKRAKLPAPKTYTLLADDSETR